MFIVAGVTGHTGAVVAEALLGKGKKVRVLVRDARKGDVWKAKGAEVAVAELDDATALARALEGAQGAYLLSPPDMGATDLIAQRRATVDAIARAVDDSRLPHGVFLSSIGVQHETGTGPIRTVRYAEKRLASTSGKWTFVRAAYFIENFGAVLGAVQAGTLPTFVRPDLAIPMVGTRDIGLVAANALLEGPPSGKVDAIELAGTREHDAHDVARTLAKILGRDVAVQGAPEEAIVPTFTGMGVSANVAELYREMIHGANTGLLAWEGGSARLVRGTHDLETVLRGMVQPA